MCDLQVAAKLADLNKAEHARRTSAEALGAAPGSNLMDSVCAQPPRGPDCEQPAAMRRADTQQSAGAAAASSTAPATPDTAAPHSGVLGPAVNPAEAVGCLTAACPTSAAIVASPLAAGDAAAAGPMQHTAANTAPVRARASGTNSAGRGAMKTTAAVSTKSASPSAVVTTPAVVSLPAREPGWAAPLVDCSAKAAELQAAVAALAAVEAAPEDPVRPRQAIVAARPGRPLGRRQCSSRRADGALQWQLNANRAQSAAHNRQLTISKEAMEYWGLDEEQQVFNSVHDLSACILGSLSVYFQQSVWHLIGPRSGSTSVGLPTYWKSSMHQLLTKPPKAALFGPRCSSAHQSSEFRHPVEPLKL